MYITYRNPTEIKVSCSISQDEVESVDNLVVGAYNSRSRDDIYKGRRYCIDAIYVVHAFCSSAGSGIRMDSSMIWVSIPRDS